MDQVWYLKGMAERVGLSEECLRRKLFDSLGGEAFSQLVEDDQVQAFLPPIGGVSVRIFGDLARLGNPATPTAVRLHDFCHDGDAGACICSCCIYRDYAVKRCIQIAQAGGVGIMIEGLDEATGYGLVAKHTIYNGRDNHPQGDDPRNYYSFRRAINGGDDGRMPWTKLAVLHLLGVTKIDEWISMSDAKRHDLECLEGIAIVKQIDLPKSLRRSSYSVELKAKIARGYYSTES